MKVLLVGKEDERESSVFAEHLGVIVRIPERHAAVFSVHFDKQLFGSVRCGSEKLFDHSDTVFRAVCRCHIERFINF